MTRILYFPSESTFFTLESELPAGRILLAVSNGKWHPPAGIPRPDRPSRSLRAVRLGRSTVLIFRPLDLEQLHGASEPGRGLGQRQMAVLQCVAGGMTAQQAAIRLGVSRRTVYSHLAAIRRSFSAISTAEAVRRAAELGLCQPPATR